jgi:hypothetical protein
VVIDVFFLLILPPSWIFFNGGANILQHQH